MTVKASNESIKALKPLPVRYEKSVKGHRGLVVTVWPSGEKAWTYRGRIDGKLYRERIGAYPAMPLVEALLEFSKLREQRAKGVNLAARRQRAAQTARQAPTVKALCRDYIDRHAKPKKRTWVQDQRMLDKDVIPAWGRLKAEGITKADVNALLDLIVDRGSPMQANKVLALVRKLFNFGIDRGLLSINPAARIPRPAKARTRNNVLSDADLRALAQSLARSGLRPQIAGAIRLQLLTGQRIGEALQAEWSEIDLTERTWTIPAAKSKNGVEHIVPLSADAVALIKAQPHLSPYIFPAARDDRAISSDVAGHELADALPRLKTSKFTSHDLRRTVETRLASLGIGKEIRDRCLNHADRTISGLHYNKYDYLPEKRAALEQWAQLLADVVAGKRKGNVVTFKRAARA